MDDDEAGKTTILGTRSLVARHLVRQRTITPQHLNQITHDEILMTAQRARKGTSLSQLPNLTRRTLYKLIAVVPKLGSPKV